MKYKEVNKKYKKININWKEEGETINTYSDFKIKNNKQGVLDYIEFIISLNGSNYLFINEKIFYLN